jgi:Ala-tRNA(Pro) deacylase
MKLADFLQTQHVAFSVIPHREAHGSQRLAETLHVSGHQVAKTVLLRANGDYMYIVAVLPADQSIDFQRTAKLLGGSKIEMATEIEMKQHCPDCEMGVLPPFGSQYGMKTIVDESLTEDEEIVFESNTHQEAIRMKFNDFRQVEEPLIARICA